MSADGLALAAGSVLTLFFSYFPGFNARFAAKAPEVKRLIMAGLLAVVAAVVYGLGCSGFGASFGVEVACTQEGLIGLARVLLIAVIANQSLYSISPKTPAVQVANADAAFEALAE